MIKTVDAFEIRIYPYNKKHRESWVKGNSGSPTIYIKSPSGKIDTLSGQFVKGCVVINETIVSEDLTHEEKYLKQFRAILEKKSEGKEISTKERIKMKKELGYIIPDDFDKTVDELKEEITKYRKLIAFRTKTWGSPQYTRLKNIFNSEQGMFKVVLKHQSNSYKLSFTNS